MQLESLTLTDIGTFSGRKTFDLCPKPRNGSKRPIILFGGLNGAGKTTFLTAIRLALYGRHSIETGTTQKQYEQFLVDLIHRSENSLVRTTSASISLEFTYARLGERTRYKIVRSWEEQSSGALEFLRIYRNDEVEEALSGEQAQAFLNLMIPAGISQFFFFDGEKIAALARDDSDAVLADAIRRLLGLDLADRLSSDLSVYLRQMRGKASDKETQSAIRDLEAQLSTIEAEIEAATTQLNSELDPNLQLAKSEFEQRRAELMDRGGAWSVDRAELEEKQSALRSERSKIEDLIREQAAGVAVFALAPKLSKAVIGTLEGAQAAAREHALAEAIQKEARLLKAKLSEIEELKSVRKIVGKYIDGWAEDWKEKPNQATKTSSMGLTDTDARNAIASLSIAAPSARNELVNAYESARRILGETTAIQDRLAYAPSEESIKEAFERLTDATKVVADLEALRRRLIEEIRRKIWASIDLTRKLKKLEERAREGGAEVRGEEIAESLQSMIGDFKNESAAEKCKTLQLHFLKAFRRLSRKDDIVRDAKIDATDFRVTLLNKSGEEIPKKRLSAGEKQIYAIAMLEGLAKTSGRSLPIIIDTPLGRLDSKHRHKLVESYFPVASHQVIILSTDTEVDAAFYTALQPHISHGYHLAFDSEKGATNVEKGYFWKGLEEGAHAHAA
jgi:DNA sulfur modification protein DndD